VRELSFMGPSNDGKRLLLVADDGTQFELVVDSRLVSVVSREHGTSARPAKSTGKASTMPSPREIQDQIRHGATVEEIANATGVSPDDVAKFAYPVITERAYIADQARAALVKVGAELITLEAAVLQRVQPRAVDPRLLRWDAWRAEGTTWTVIAAYPANQGSELPPSRSTVLTSPCQRLTMTGAGCWTVGKPSRAHPARRHLLLPAPFTKMTLPVNARVPTWCHQHRATPRHCRIASGNQNPNRLFVPAPRTLRPTDPGTARIQRPGHMSAARPTVNPTQRTVPRQAAMTHLHHA
jgi:hypothetical protein